ncbi:serine protease [Pseudonocardiaceae bacterium YIM PH 21723]|nr:serine protease [Pseudonocardiaceae bacterium YIM PH 21723]
MLRANRLSISALALVLAGAAVTAPAEATASEPCGGGTSYRYVVLFDPATGQDAAGREVTAACGKVETFYPQIGVAVASSTDPKFDTRMGVDRAYSAGRAAATPGSASREKSVVTAEDEVGDLSAQSWDMRAIHTDEAQKITQGSPNVVVGVLDSGVDGDHPDLKPALRRDLSVGCETGTPNPDPATWYPQGDHGTHVAGTIAAAKDGKGMTGIAPGVGLASVRVIEPHGYILPEAAVCGFVWAAEHHFAVTNSSWFADPWVFWCTDKPGEKVGYEAMARAIRYSTKRGVLNVAASGNFGTDISKPVKDFAKDHPVDANCKVVPAQVDDVVSVSAVGYGGYLSSYSDWGKVDIAAPGGDRAQTPPEGQGAGCPLSTLPSGKYGTMCGTSMATPHVAGVAALLASKNQRYKGRTLRNQLLDRAVELKCPLGQTPCLQGEHSNTYYGHGLADALAAVS